MIKILVTSEAGQLNGVTFWRAIRPLSILRRMYPDQIDYTLAKRGVPVFDLASYDVLFALRPNSVEDKNVIETAKLLGLKVILDVDDDLCNVPPMHPKYLEFEAQKEIFRECYALADWVWCSTEQLQFAMDCIGRSSVMPNAVLPEDLPDKPAPWRGIACWRGSIMAKDDVENDEARKVYEKYAPLYDRFVWFGYTPNLPHGTNFVARKSVDTLSYFFGLRNSGVNVTWKPMRDNLFNRAKSNIAWIEATMGGGICVTNFALEPGWEHCVSVLDFHRDYIPELWQESREAILKDYNLVTVNENRFSDIQNLVKNGSVYV